MRGVSRRNSVVLNVSRSTANRCENIKTAAGARRRDGPLRAILTLTKKPEQFTNVGWVSDGSTPLARQSWRFRESCQDGGKLRISVTLHAYKPGVHSHGSGRACYPAFRRPFELTRRRRIICILKKGDSPPTTRSNRERPTVSGDVANRGHRNGRDRTASTGSLVNPGQTKGAQP